MRRWHKVCKILYDVFDGFFMIVFWGVCKIWDTIWPILMNYDIPFDVSDGFMLYSFLYFPACNC